MNYGDRLAESYDAHAGEREERGEPQWRSRYRDDFVRRLPAGGRILEIGAGVGYTSRWFADQGFDVLATDLSGENVARCREKGVPAEVRDLRALQLDPGSFDAVWAASCLMHVSDADLPAALDGIATVLAPGGWFWSGTWGGNESEGIWEEDWYVPKRFYSFRSDERIRAFYEQAFVVESWSTIDPEPSIAQVYQIALMRHRFGG